MDSYPLILLSVLFLSFPLSFSQKPSALVSQVTKDPSTLQYITKVNQRTPLVTLNLAVDLSGQNLWVDCDKGYVSSTYRPVRCRSAACSAANGVGCGNHCFSKPRPGCNNNTCIVALDNSFTRVTTEGELATDVFSMRSTDGSKLGPAVTDPHFIFSCGRTSLLEGLAQGTTGIIGLGRSKVAAPQQLAAAFGFQRTFAICLSSSSSIGYMFIGGGPYVFLPGIDLSISLSYTPLLVNPVSIYTPLGIPEYFIGVKSININDKPVKLNGTLLQMNKNGIGGTRISTLHPYTLLERSIYKAVLSAFGAGLSHAKRVAPIAPFGLCFDANSIQTIPRLVGPDVPTIDLVLQNTSVTWSIIGANSMVAVGNDALCLGFVDAGINPTTSIVIGGYQLENNLLEFDPARSRLGFSNSLIWDKIFCSNFNYTT